MHFYRIIKLFFVFLFISASICKGFGQTEVDFNYYSQLHSVGNLPEALIISSTEKYEQQKQSIGNNEQKKIKQLKNQFYLESTFSLDNLLRSGKVLFNDPVGQYVNTVFSKVKASAGLSDNTASLYIIKTNYANAFAADQGIVFITTGLLARLKSEAQLAFILCHELTHFTKKHSIDKFLRNKTQTKDVEYLNDIDIIASASYSKEKESEADKEGLSIFLKAGYEPEAAISMFDVLHYSHLPFENEPFEKSFFEDENLKWPNSFRLNQLDSVFLSEETDDTYSTHPNIHQRKTAIKALLDIDSVLLDKEGIASNDSEFLLIRKICRFEYCHSALLSAKYCEAVYAAYILLKDEPNSFYLKKIIGKALYSISTYYNYNRKADLKLDYKKTQGEFQQVYAFFENMYAYEANMLAVRYLWELKQQFPNDYEIDALSSKSLNYFTFLHFPDINSFKTTSLPVSLYQEKVNDTLFYDFYVVKKDTSGLSMDSVKKADILNRKERVLYSFHSLLKDNAFVEAYTLAAKETDSLRANVKRRFNQNATVKYSSSTWGEINSNYKVYLDSLISYKKHITAAKEKLAEKEFAGLFNAKLKKKKGEKVIFFNPLYYSIDEREDVALKYVASERNREKIFTRIKTSAKAAKLPFEFLADNSFEQTDAEKINSITLINNWINEHFLHKDMDILPVDYEKINGLSNNLNSRYLCLPINMYTIYKKDDIASYVALSIVVPFYSWPLTFPYLFTKDIKTDFYLLAFDLKDRRLVYSGSRHLTSKNKEDISLTTFYDFFLNLKTYQID